MMLRLEVDKGERDSSNHDYILPKYIALSGACNIIGRGFKTSVRLPFPWLSRKHLTITRVDGNCILESDGQNATYVNNKRVEFTRLSDGDMITIGGGRKSTTVGAPFPITAGPHVVYSYHKSAKEMKDKENCYKDTTKPEDLIQLTDMVNGQMVNQSYHLEDFNCTDDLTPADRFSNTTLINETLIPTTPVSKNTSTPLADSSIIGSPCKSNIKQSASASASPKLPRPKLSIPLKPKHADTSNSKLNVDTKPNECDFDSGKNVSKLTSDVICSATIATCDEPSRYLVASPLINARSKRKGRAAATACKEMLSSLSKPGPKSAETSSQESLSLEKNSEVTMEEVKTKVIKPKKVARGRKPKASANPSSTETKPNDSLVTETESLKEPCPVSDSASKLIPMDDAADKIDSVCIVQSPSPNKPILDLDPGIDSESTKAVQPPCNPWAVIDFMDKLPDLDLNGKPLVVEELPDLDIEERVRTRKRKRVSYTYPDSQGDSDFKPDEQELAEADDCIDVDEFIPANPIKRVKLEQAPISKGKGTGKGRTGKGKNKKWVDPRDAEEQTVIDSWQTKIIPRPKPKWVDVLDGEYRRSLYSFTDKETFKVVYKKGEDKISENLWDADLYDVTVSLDSALLEYKLKLNLLDQDDFTKVLRLIRKSSTTLKMEDYDQPTPATQFRQVNQPEALKIELKRYQLDTLGWMCLVEGQVERKWHVSKLADWPESETDLMFDMVNRRVYFPPVPTIPSTEYRVSIKGGILADEMGLGKTITLLSLILTHQGTDFPRIPPPEAFRNHELLHLPTRATLVIAPSHLTAQWKHEAETHAPGMRVILITTKPQFERISYVDILRADLVVVSVQFLVNNKAYTTMPSGADAETSFMRLLVKPGINPLQQKAPNFGHFNWWRLVCDEAHELITYENKYNNTRGSTGYEIKPSNGLTILEKIEARHKWYMTGTPFPHQEKSLRGALKFLEFKIDDPSLCYPDGSLKIDMDVSSYATDFAKDSLYLSPLHKFILDTVYVRNTKQSIGQEYNVPEYVEELMLLTMSGVEKGIYDRAVSERERRQLCCHLQIATRVQMIAGIQQKTLEEVKEAMISHAKTEVDRTERMIVTTEEDIKRSKKEYAAEERANYRNMIDNRIKRYREAIKQYGETIKKHQSSLAYFENLVPRVTQSADEPCVICFDAIDQLTMTPCGHLYCKKCIIPCVQQLNQCPTCRKACSENELVQVQDPRQRETLDKSAELEKLTEQFGTKMAYLIFYIRHLFKNDSKSRVIIFSQWDELLHKIGSTLHDNGIRNVFVKGNVHVRNKAIMSFRKQEKTRVIMLSLQNAASGTNLVEASHVILIDPVAGSKQEAVSVEAQAIGRAHRMGQDKEIVVVRMIVKDTIEHELYLRNNADSIKQVELNFDEQEAGTKVIRRVRKVPKPTSVELPAASVFANNEPSTSVASSSRSSLTQQQAPRQRKKSSGGGRRQKRGWGSGWGGGWRRRRRFDFLFDMCGDDSDHDSNGCDCESCAGYF